MGKEIVWPPISLQHLEDIHSDILEVSKSLNSADRVVGEILESTGILSAQPEIYTLDENKLNNDGSYRPYEVRTYNIAYRILKEKIRILRIRSSKKEKRPH